MVKNTTHKLDNKDEYFMELAIREAKKAFRKGEVPIGAVIELNGKVFSKAHNLRIKKKDALAHAELLAISKACRKLGDWRLKGMTLYVTVEPCLMCAGAIIHSRIDRLVYGCTETKMGAVCSMFKVFNKKGQHHRVLTKGAVLTDNCQSLLKDFFKQLRK